MSGNSLILLNSNQTVLWKQNQNPKISKNCSGYEIQNFPRYNLLQKFTLRHVQKIANTTFLLVSEIDF